MSLTLSPDQCAALKEAMGALSRPLAFDSDITWRERVLRSVKRLVGADKATMILLGADVPSFSAEYGSGLAPYLDRLAPLLEKRKRLRITAPSPVYNRRLLWGPMLEDFYASSYFNDYVRSIRGFGAIGMGIPARECDSLSLVSHHLVCHYDRRGVRASSEEELQLLSLLYPSFEAGIRIWEDYQTREHAFTTALDRCGARIGIYSQEGCRIHQTPALTEVLMADPKSAEVVEASAALATATSHRQRQSKRSGAPDFGVASRPVRCIKTPVATYRLTGSVASEHLTGQESLVLIFVDLLSRHGPPGGIVDVPDPETLRSRFVLTRRQAEVARLLAARYTNREVADTLDISPHTARHHTQAVLEALGISSRREVTDRLREA